LAVTVVVVIITVALASSAWIFWAAALLCVLGTAISIKCFKQPFVASHILHVETAIVAEAVLEAAPKGIPEEATFRIDATLGWVGIKAAVMRENFSIPLGAPLAVVGTTLQVVNTVVVAVTVPLINATKIGSFFTAVPSVFCTMLAICVNLVKLIVHCFVAVAADEIVTAVASQQITVLKAATEEVSHILTVFICVACSDHPRLTPIATSILALFTCHCVASVEARGMPLYFSDIAELV